MEPWSPALQANFFTVWATWEAPQGPVADAYWCMAKPIQYCKVKNNNNNNKIIKKKKRRRRRRRTACPLKLSLGWGQKCYRLMERALNSTEDSLESLLLIMRQLLLDPSSTWPKHCIRPFRCLASNPPSTSFVPSFEVTVLPRHMLIVLSFISCVMLEKPLSMVLLISSGPWPTMVWSGISVPSQRLRSGCRGESTKS